jgi:drug/metabolite transporter (DMT)-like permease
VAFSVISLYTSVGLIFVAPFGEPTSVVDFSPLVWTICIISALLGIACAHGLFYIAVQRIGVAICTLTLMAAPFLTFLCSHWWFGEDFTLGQWGGGFLLIFGSSLALWTQKHLHEPEPGTSENGES